ncbi:MAG: hypothetical protein A2X42_02815 [Candidatus Margulisbacteria bacterium GWF2_38_17]|nr:MAG: hypothetical protein A2X43_04305 [Candidatus Margulisbacteria bacterium GWD2_39_127]OGI05252.1 MAG: hypothetical protein A2X42_02815 [Candidatus Margulisbacteria bacterium GWF2_38_17]OGI06303.1 MAG: hypothetical protein A2X41_08395 [Candidatus Margulisbacteria bacterium GWE2_39_32]
MPKGEKFLTVARLAASGIASKMNFPQDEIEDIKMALTEACNNTLPSFNECKNNICINFLMQSDKLEITIEDKSQILEKEDYEKKNALGISFIKSLMDEMEYITDKKLGTTIKMSKYKDG